MRARARVCMCVSACVRVWVCVWVCVCMYVHVCAHKQHNGTGFCEVVVTLPCMTQQSSCTGKQAAARGGLQHAEPPSREEDECFYCNWHEVWHETHCTQSKCRRYMLQEDLVMYFMLFLCSVCGNYLTSSSLAFAVSCLRTHYIGYVL